MMESGSWEWRHDRWFIQDSSSFDSSLCCFILDDKIRGDDKTMLSASTSINSTYDKALLDLKCLIINTPCKAAFIVKDNQMLFFCWDASLIWINQNQMMESKMPTIDFSIMQLQISMSVEIILNSSLKAISLNSCFQ